MEGESRRHLPRSRLILKNSTSDRIQFDLPAAAVVYHRCSMDILYFLRRLLFQLVKRMRMKIICFFFYKL